MQDLISHEHASRWKCHHHHYHMRLPLPSSLTWVLKKRALRSYLTQLFAFKRNNCLMPFLRFKVFFPKIFKVSSLDCFLKNLLNLLAIISMPASSKSLTSSSLSTIKTFQCISFYIFSLVRKPIRSSKDELLRSFASSNAALFGLHSFDKNIITFFTFLL